MGLVTSPAERAIHLVLFVAAAVAFAVAALAILERITGREERSIRLVHVAIPVALFVATFIAERVYHTMH